MRGLTFCNSAAIVAASALCLASTGAPASISFVGEPYEFVADPADDSSSLIDAIDARASISLQSPIVYEIVGWRRGDADPSAPLNLPTVNDYTIDSEGGGIFVNSQYQDRGFQVADVLTVRASITGWDGTPHTTETEVRVRFAEPTQCDIVSVSMGLSGPSCAVSSSGRYWCWGACGAASGQCGYGEGASELIGEDGRLDRPAAAGPLRLPSGRSAADVVSLKSDLSSQVATCVLATQGLIECRGKKEYMPWTSSADVDQFQARSLTVPDANGQRWSVQGWVTSIHAGSQGFCMVLNRAIDGKNVVCWGSTADSGLGSDVATANMGSHTNGLVLLGLPAMLRSGSVSLGNQGGCGISQTDSQLVCWGQVSPESDGAGAVVSLPGSEGAEVLVVGVAETRACAATGSYIKCFGRFVPDGEDEAQDVASDDSTVGYYPMLSGTPTSIAVTAEGFCVATDSAELSMQCSVQASNLQGGADGFHVDWPEAVQLSATGGPATESSSNLQFIQVAGPNQQVTSVSASGCSFCAIVEPAQGASQDPAVVRCFGCDGPESTWAGVPMRGSLGMGPLAGSVGGSPSTAALQYGALELGDRLCKPGQVASISQPRAGSFYQVFEQGLGDGLEIGVIAGGRAATLFLDPSYPGSDLLEIVGSANSPVLRAKTSVQFDNLAAADRRFTLGLVAYDGSNPDRTFAVSVFEIEILEDTTPKWVFRRAQPVTAGGRHFVRGRRSIVSPTTRTVDTLLTIDAVARITEASGLQVQLQLVSTSEGIEASMIDLSQASTVRLTGNPPLGFSHRVVLKAVSVDGDGSVVAEQPIQYELYFDVVCTGGFATNTRDNRCDSCPAGRYSWAGSTWCPSCSSSSFQDETEQTTCKSCSGFLPGQQWIRHRQSGATVPCDVCTENAWAANGRWTCECKTSFQPELPVGQRDQLECDSVPSLATDIDEANSPGTLTLSVQECESEARRAGAVSVEDANVPDSGIVVANAVLQCPASNGDLLELREGGGAGEIDVWYTGAALDFEAEAEIECTVTITDPAPVQGEEAVDVITVVVRVGDCNEPPSFLAESRDLRLEMVEAEPDQVGQFVVNSLGSLAASDPDTDASKSSIVYSIATQPSPSIAITVDPSSGDITYSGPGLSFDTEEAAGRTVFQFTVRVTDDVVNSDGAAFTDDTTLTIELVPDNKPPVFSPSLSTLDPIMVRKDAPMGSAVGPRLTIADPNEEDTHTFTITGCTSSRCVEALGFDPSSEDQLRVIRTDFRNDDGDFAATLTVQAEDDRGLTTAEEQVEVLVLCPLDSCSEGGQLRFGPCSRSGPASCFDADYQGEGGAQEWEYTRRPNRANSASGQFTSSLLSNAIGDGSIEARRNDQCEPVLQIDFGKRQLNPSAFFRVTGGGDCGDIDECPVVGVVGVSSKETVDVALTGVGRHTATKVRVQSISSSSQCIRPGADLASLPSSCYTDVSLLNLPAPRCHCQECRPAEGQVPTTYRNPVCQAETFEALMVGAATHCLQCTKCTGTQYETRSCQGSHPDDDEASSVGTGGAIDGTLGPAFLDRTCEDCTVCEYDEYQVEDCHERADRVCSPKMQEGFPRRREDGGTGSRGRISNVYSGDRRGPRGEVHVSVRYSDRRAEDDALMWFRIRETARGDTKYTYVFRQVNHEEAALVLGRTFRTAALSFELSYLKLGRGQNMPEDRPEDSDPRWARSGSVPIGTHFVDDLQPATAVGEPLRSVRGTGSRGRMDNLFANGLRDENCRVQVAVRYVCSSHGAGAECAEEQTFAIRETRRGDVRFGRTVTIARDTEQVLDLGNPHRSDLEFTLQYSDGRGGWRNSNKVQIGKTCLETFSNATEVWRKRNDRPTGARGRLVPVYGERRAANGDILLQVQYFDLNGPDVDRFVIRETRRGDVRLAKQVVLANGEEVQVNMGQPHRSDLRFTLFYERRDSRGEWVAGQTVDISKERIETFPVAMAAAGEMPKRTTHHTGSRGRIVGVYGEQRASDCHVHAIVRYNDRHGCEDEERTFVIRETRRGDVRLAQQVTLTNGQELKVDLGNPHRSDLEFTLQYADGRGGWRNGNKIQIGKTCVDLFADAEDDATVVAGRGGRYDSHTGSRGRIMQVWARKRAGAQSGLQNEGGAAVVRGDVIVRVAYNEWHGAEPKRFLLQEVRRGDVQFARAVTLRTGEEKWLNLGQFKNADLQFAIHSFDPVHGWTRGSLVDISKETVEDFEPAQQAGGYPLPNFRPTGSNARMETITGDERLCDGSVALHLTYCEDVTTAPESRTFVLRETQRGDTDYSVAVEIPNCHETVVIVPASELLANRDYTFSTFRSDGEGGWTRFGPSFQSRRGRIDGDTCPSQLDLPGEDEESEHEEGARRLRAGVATGSSIRDSVRASGVDTSSRIQLAAQVDLAAVDPSALGSAAASAARAGMLAYGNAQRAQLEGVRASTQDAVRKQLAESDPELAAEVTVYVNANPTDGELGLAVFPASQGTAVASALSSAGQVLASAAGMPAGSTLDLVNEDELVFGEPLGDDGAASGGTPTASGNGSGTAATDADQAGGAEEGELPAIALAAMGGSGLIALAAVAVAAVTVVRSRGIARTAPASGSALPAAGASGAAEHGGSLRPGAAPGARYLPSSEGPDSDV